jgi:hypothetical protein
MPEPKLIELEARVEQLSARVQELLDREEITQLRARYFRLVDAQDWDAWRELFTDDLEFDFGDGEVRHGADAFLAVVRELMDGESGRVTTVHHGHLPEVTIDGPTDAHGLWVLVDYVEWPADPGSGERRGRVGYGYEHDGYRKEDGVWKICRWRLEYLRVDPLRPEPLPERFFRPEVRL